MTQAYSPKLVEEGFGGVEFVLDPPTGQIAAFSTD
jgi:hypothetical protein